MAEEVFDAGHHVFEVGVSFVPFEEGEFGVVTVGDAFVAEDAANFVDFGDVAANDALEVKLEGDSEFDFEIVGVVVSKEGAGGGATGFELEERGFDFEVTAGIKESADFADDSGSVEELLAGFSVCDEVEVAVAIALIDIGEAVPLLAIFFFAEREGVEGFAEGGEGLDVNGFLAGLSGEEVSGDAEVVADIEEFEGGPGVFAGFVEVVFADVDLDFVVTIGEVGEGGFAHFAESDDAAGE